MKKLLFSTTAALLLSVGAFAQGGLGYGLRGGVNLPKYQFEGDNATDHKNNTNFYVTGYLDAPLSSNFSIQPGVSLQGKGAKWDGKLGTVTSEQKQSTMWIEVPVNLVAKLPTGASGNFFVGAGPYVGFGISGKNKFSASSGENSVVTENNDFSFGSESSDDQKGVDFGVNFLGGYQFSNGFSVNAGYGLGLSNLSNANNGTLKNRVLSFGIGFGI